MTGYVEDAHIRKEGTCPFHVFIYGERLAGRAIYRMVWRRHNGHSRSQQNIEGIERLTHAESRKGQASNMSPKEAD